MYCAVEEAFNNPLSQQIKNYENEIQNRSFNNDNNNNFRRSSEPSFFTDKPSFFTAQGDYNNKQCGTRISDIHKSMNQDSFDDSFLFSESDSDIDTIQTLNSSISIPTISSDKTEVPKILKEKPKEGKKNKHSHEYFIKKFIQSIIDTDIDMLSLTSSQDDEIYGHIKKCKYCRSKINTKMMKYYNDKNKPIVNVKNNSINKTNKEVPNLRSSEKTKHNSLINNEIKEIIIVILVGIIIIFVLDLFVKIGRRTNKEN